VNELFARKNMDFLLILEKKPPLPPPPTAKKKEEEEKNQRLRKLIRGTVKNPAPPGSNKNPVAGNEDLLQ